MDCSQDSLAVKGAFVMLEALLGHRLNILSRHRKPSFNTVSELMRGAFAVIAGALDVMLRKLVIKCFSGNAEC